MNPVRSWALAAIVIVAALSGCVSAPPPAKVQANTQGTAATDANETALIAELTERYRSNLAAVHAACADDNPELAIVHVKAVQAHDDMLVALFKLPPHSADIQNALLFDALATQFADTSPVCNYLSYKFARLAIGYYQRLIDQGAPTQYSEVKLPKIYEQLAKLGPLAKLNPQTTAYFEQEQRHAVEAKDLPGSQPN